MSCLNPSEWKYGNWHNFLEKGVREKMLILNIWEQLYVFEK